MIQSVRDRQESFRARMAMLGRKEIRGVYLPPDLHSELKNLAARLLLEWETRQNLPTSSSGK